MRDENKRTLFLKIRMSPKEMDAIKRKFQNSGMDNFSEFVRAMIFEGCIVQVNESEMHQLLQLAGNIASNINHIAVRVNRTGRIYGKDIEEIKDGVEKLWQPLIYLQTRVGMVKKS